MVLAVPHPFFAPLLTSLKIKRHCSESCTSEHRQHRVLLENLERYIVF